jgi:uncharacterized membrane protein
VKLSRTSIGLLLLVALAQSFWYYPQLPDTVASHFDGAGRPNGWSGKGSFLALYLLIVGAVASIFLVAGSRIRSRPDMRIPHREYWLAPERSGETIAFLRRNLHSAGTVSLALAIAVMQFAILANFEDPPRISAAVYGVLLAYFLYLVLWLLRLYWRFRRPPG